MEIGVKIKNARSEAKLSQEQSAEALGVSRQTVSNWENGRTFPDIISVIKMSDLYSVSLDRLLKEENSMNQTYNEYLKESTDTVRSKNKLSKIVLISTYLLIYAAAELILWLFAPGSGHAEVFYIIFLYTLLPLATFVFSLFTGAYQYFGRLKWLFPVAFGVLSMLVPYSSFKLLTEARAAFAFSWPNFAALPIGAAISAVGLVLGVFFQKRKKDI